MQSQQQQTDDPLVIAGVEYHSRLLTETGKYRDLNETREATEASGAEIVTVAIRRTISARTLTSPTCWISSHRINTPCCRTRPAAIAPRMRCAPADWHANCWTGISWSSWKFSAMKKAIEAGREAFLARRISRKRYASASTPIDDAFF
jgi:thiazole synthase ThiGH ThiG subunit